MPAILIIDDQEEQSALAQHLGSTGLVSAKLLHPNDVTLDDLLSVDLVLVDYRLDDWPERDAISQLSLSPPDGLAVAFLLRRHLHGGEKDSPTSIAMLTGQIEKLASPLALERREHVLAHMNNLEWVFQKAKPNEDSRLITQLVDLATAVSSLPQRWGTEIEPMSQLAQLLSVSPDAPLSDKLLEEVEACNPPIHELSRWSHGLTVLRWVLQRILPYPCFLWDGHYLAARLAISYGSFVSALSDNDKCRKFFEPAEYEGILSNFSGSRWWRSRVEFLLWELTGGQSADPDLIRQQFGKHVGIDFLASEPAINPIVCINTDYQPLDRFYSIKDSVRIRPDDWPPYADQAWTTVELARSEPKLKSLVLLEDKERLGLN